MSRAQEIRTRYLNARHTFEHESQELVKKQKYQNSAYAQELFEYILEILEILLKNNEFYICNIQVLPQANNTVSVICKGTNPKTLNIPFDKKIFKQVVKLFKKEKGYYVRYKVIWSCIAQFEIKIK